jgi:hypothetical protein
MLTHSLQINVNGWVAAEATGEGWLIARMLEKVIYSDKLESILNLKVHTTASYDWRRDDDRIEAKVTRISQSASELTHDPD